MRHTNVDGDAIQALAHVDHRVAHVESNGRLRSERHTTRDVQESYLYERRAPGFFFFCRVVRLRLLAIRRYVPDRRPLDSGIHVLRRRSSKLKRCAIQLPVASIGLWWVKGHCYLVPACQAVMAVRPVQYRSRHAERQANDKSRSVGGRRSPWPLACVPQRPYEW